MKLSPKNFSNTYTVQLHDYIHTEIISIRGFVVALKLNLVTVAVTK